jgi:hypothetical protein
MVSQETSKLCFEMLEMNSASQNNLPCGAGKRLRSRRFIKLIIEAVNENCSYCFHLNVFGKVCLAVPLLPMGSAFQLF